MATRLMLLFKAALLAVLAFGFTGASAGAAQSNVLPVGQEWTLVSYQGTDGQTIDTNGYGVTIMFGTDGRVSGNGGCNGFGGSYTTGADGLLTISQVISTKRACEDETRTQFESRYFAALEGANDYLANETQLEVMFAKSAGRLIFAKSGGTGAALPQAVTAGAWTLTGYKGADGQSSDVSRYNITIKFSTDGKISGFGGCNGYGGVYQTGANEDLTLSEIISTLMACEEDNKTQWESRYFAALQTVSQYKISGNTLQLMFDNGAGLLTFAPAPAPTLPQQLLGSTWTLVGYQGPAATFIDLGANGITIMFGADGRVSGFGGCNGYGGVYTVGSNNALTISEILSTLIACADDSKTQWESRYFAALQTVSQYSFDGNRLQLVFDNGAGLLTFAPGAGSSTGNTPGMPTTGAGETPIWPVALGAALIVVLGGLALRSRATWLARREI